MRVIENVLVTDIKSVTIDGSAALKFRAGTKKLSGGLEFWNVTVVEKQPLEMLQRGEVNERDWVNIYGFMEKWTGKDGNKHEEIFVWRMDLPLTRKGGAT